jgi:hypothetical protein
MQQYGKVVRLECSWALWKEWSEAFPTVPPAGQTDKWKVLKARVKAENVPKWAQRSQESIWESGWEIRYGAGKRVMECDVCTENDKEGSGCSESLFRTFSALTRALSTFHLSVCPAGGTVGNASLHSFQRAQEHSNLTTFPYCCMSTHAEYTNSSRARTDNRMNSVPQLYSIDLGTFRVALLFRYPQRC